MDDYRIEILYLIWEFTLTHEKWFFFDNTASAKNTLNLTNWSGPKLFSSKKASLSLKKADIHSDLGACSVKELIDRILTLPFGIFKES